MDKSQTQDLFRSTLQVVNLGLPSFGSDVAGQGTKVISPKWAPPAGGDARSIEALDAILGWPQAAQDAMVNANRLALQRLLAAHPAVVGVGKAIDCVPGMHPRKLLHAGPPVTWDRMCGPMRGGVIGGLLYEGLANSREQAEKLASSGEIEFAPCHHHQAVGPMAGITTASMPVWIIENRAFGNRSFSTLNEGLGKVLRYGAFSDEVLKRLAWMRDELGPAMAMAIERHGPLDLRSLIAQALQMGDEGHNRNRAATSLVIRALAPHLVESSLERDAIARVLRFIDGNDHFFLNLSMAASKSAVDAIADIPWSTVISTMARNGTDFGVRLAGLPGKWFAAPATMVDGLYLPGFGPQDAAPDIGDSVITETAGIGGFAMAAAPAIVKFVGGNASDALRYTRSMFEITEGENAAYQIPSLDFRGTPTAVNVSRVVETNILPAVNTGIAHKEPGIGMVGAGLVKPPVACFREALIAFVREYGPKAAQ